jgi:hypothetical protein
VAQAVYARGTPRRLNTGRAMHELGQVRRRSRAFYWLERLEPTAYASVLSAEFALGGQR